MVYIQFAMMPLFLPSPGVIHFTYGNRLNNVFREVGVIASSAPSSEVDEWCNYAINHITMTVFPQIDLLSTADGICQYVEDSCNSVFQSTKKGDELIFCGTDQWLELYMYCKLYLKEYDQFMRAANQYVSAINSHNSYTHAIKSKKVQEVNDLIALVSKCEFNTLERQIYKWKSDNINLFLL